MSDSLILKCTFGPAGGPGMTEDYDVLHDGSVVGRVFKDDGMTGRPWFWGMGYGHHRDRHPGHGHEVDRAAAMAAFAKSWRRE